jgi:H+/gluconate symporter-like permease
MLPILNTASEVGYGNVIASLPAFVIVREAMTHLTSNPVLLTFISVSTLAGITGSASGGLSIALSTISEQLVATAKATGVSVDLLHRVAAMASGSFDTLPHNGAVITLLSICGLNHRQSYFDIFIVSSVITAAATIAVIVLGSIFGAF